LRHQNTIRAGSPQNSVSVRYCDPSE
jgi:hypothetical protein